MKNTGIPVFTILSFCLLLFSCRNKESSTEEGRIPDTLKETGMEELNSVYDSVTYLFPSPGEVLERFYHTDLVFEPELMNSVSKEDKYLTSAAKALNLGVYFTDFAYSVVFEKQQEAIDYLETMNSMSREMNITPAIYKSLVDRTRSNLGNRDSLLQISRDMFFTILEYLEEGEMRSTLASVSAGAYIEALYIALQSVSDYSGDSKILKSITEFQYPMANLLERTRSYHNAGNMSNVEKYLTEINEVFMQLDTLTERTNEVRSSGNELFITGGSNVLITEEDYIRLKNKVTEIRNTITQNQEKK